MEKEKFINNIVYDVVNYCKLTGIKNPSKIISSICIDTNFGEKEFEIKDYLLSDGNADIIKEFHLEKWDRCPCITGKEYVLYKVGDKLKVNADSIIKDKVGGNNIGILHSGKIIECLEVEELSNSIWIKCDYGWLCAVNHISYMIVPIY